MEKILKIIGKILAAAVALLALIFIYFNLPVRLPDQPYQLGVTFSSRYARDLGLDWKEAYTAILDELGVKKLRIPVYWDLVEPEKDSYRFEDIDWQLDEAAKRNAEVILVVGQRVPRWPECFIPQWIDTDEKRKEELIEVVKTTVERYRGREEITSWQVENEPFLLFFGICPELDKELFKKELETVRSLDQRPIIVTDSGELSFWHQAAKRADIFGTTMYRTVYKEPIGYYTYPVGPNFFKFKTALINILAKQDKAIVVELQAEPWSPRWITDVSLEEQLKVMDEDKLAENIRYARKGNFTEIYLWGAEWWYWLKEKKDYDKIWNRAREMFSR